MKRSPQSVAWFFIAVVFATFSTMLLLSYMVTDPGHVINELGGDCGKNYFTFLYHSVFGKGLWFEGMNYPYGEHIIYADGQPVLSTFLQLFQPLNPHTALATMNLLIALSYVVAIVFTYKTLRLFGVNPLIAILFACLINLLSPQVMRVRAHFGLAYMFPIPMLFYCSLMFHNGAGKPGNFRWALYIFIMGAIMSFIHLYLGGIIFIWVALYTVACLLFSKGPLKSRFRKPAPLLIAAAFLFAWIKGVIALTDPVTDRPTFPLNTLESVTHYRDIITSPHSPFWQMIRTLFKFRWISDAGEGFTYLGLATLIILLTTLALFLAGKFQKRASSPGIVSQELFSPVWLFIGAGALLLAMGAPFIWHMHWLLNYMSIFKQFRAMGRFSWIFYYVATLYAVVTLHTWFVNHLAARRPFAAYAILCSTLLVWSWEVSGNVRYTRGFIANALPTCDDFFYKNEMKWPEYLAQHQLKADDFQAIILLPLFVSGSEKLWVGGDPSWPLSLGMRAATELHLPIVDVMMSRTSWSQTKKQVKTKAGPYADKPMLRDLKSNKPFLVLWFDSKDLDQDELYLLKSADFIGNHFRNHIFVVYPDRIRANDQENKDHIKNILTHMQADDTCMGNCGPMITDHFDGHHANNHFFGDGACAPIRNEDSVILNVPFQVTGDSVLYELSGWFLLDNKDYKSPYLNLKQFDSSGKEVAFIDALTTASVDNSDMWFRASVYVYIKGTTRSIKLILNNRPGPTYLAFDELQMRPADATVISKNSSGKVLVNNHLLDLNGH